MRRSVKTSIFQHTYSMEQSPPWEANRFSVSQEIPTFYGTRRSITALTSARHLSLSWARSIQSVPSHPTSWRSVLRVSPHLHLGPPSGVLPSGFPAQTLYTPFLPPYVLHAPPVSFFSISTLTLRHSKSYNNYCALSQCFADHFLFRKTTTDPPRPAHVNTVCPDDAYKNYKFISQKWFQTPPHNNRMCNKALQDFVARFVGKGSFLIRYSNDAVIQENRFRRHRFSIDTNSWPLPFPSNNCIILAVV